MRLVVGSALLALAAFVCLCPPARAGDDREPAAGPPSAALKERLAEASAALEEARAVRKQAEAAGDEEAAAAARRRIEELEKRVVALKRELTGSGGAGTPAEDAKRKWKAQATEVEGALKRARAEREDAVAKGEERRAEELTGKIATLERRMEELRAGPPTTPDGGPKPVKPDAVEGPDKAEGAEARRLQALRKAAAVLREGGCHDLAALVEREAAGSSVRPQGGKDAGPDRAPSGAKGGDMGRLEREVQDLREEVRTLRRLLERAMGHEERSESGAK